MIGTPFQPLFKQLDPGPTSLMSLLVEVVWSKEGWPGFVKLCVCVFNCVFCKTVFVSGCVKRIKRLFGTGVFWKVDWYMYAWPRSWTKRTVHMFVFTNQSNLIFSASYKVGPHSDNFTHRGWNFTHSAFITGSGIHLLRIHTVTQ